MKKIKTIPLIIMSFFIVSCSLTDTKDVVNQSTTTITSQAGKNAKDLNVQGIMEELCSDDYLGRVVGTEENVKAGQFIKNYYEAIGLDAFCDDSYFQSFQTRGIDGSMIKSGNVENVIGYIKGKDSSKAIVVSAHFDHVYYNGDTKLPGAIDNASGVATLLETAKALKEKSKNEAFQYDIIFAAFNAEEIGLVGCNYFIEEYESRYEDWYNINIDCIGMNNNKGLAVENSFEESSALYKDFIKTLDNNNIKYENIPYAYLNGNIVGTSDHFLFQNSGKAALIIGQDGIGEVVHTPEDNLSIIDYNNITSIKDALVEFIATNHKTIY